VILNLTQEDKKQMIYILPVVASLNVLEQVEIILTKLKIEEEAIELSIQEIEFIKQMINFLDEQKKLYLASLPLIRKILNIKEK